MKKKPMSARLRKRRAYMRRDAFGRMALGVADYLASKGWNVLMTSGAMVEQLPLSRKGDYRFVLNFMGAKPVEKETK